MNGLLPAELKFRENTASYSWTPQMQTPKEKNTSQYEYKVLTL